LFSNLNNQYGGFGEAYYPVVLRNVNEFLTAFYHWVTGKKTAGQAADDGLKGIVAAYSGWDKVIKNITGDTQKRVDESRRRQFQFLDTYFPTEDTSIDYDDALTTKTPYYRAISDVFWHDDPAVKARRYYASLGYVTHRIMQDKQIPYGVAEAEARKILKGIVSRRRPIPSSWRKAKGRKSKYLNYFEKLTPQEQLEEQHLDSLYREKKSEFWQAVSDYRSVYYKRG